MLGALFCAFLISSAASCKRADELPPVLESEASEFILPDPVDLTSEERAYVNALEDEYDNAIK